MKARTRTTRWLLIAFLFGLLATAAGLTLSGHHGAPTVAKANVAAPTTSAHPVLQQPQPAFIAAVSGKHMLTAPAGTQRYRVAVSTYSNSGAPAMTGASAPQPNMSSGNGATSSSHAATLASRTVGAPLQSNRSVASATNQPPQTGAGDFA
jgi:hypothetical protein